MGNGARSCPARAIGLVLRRQCVELLSWRQSSPVVAHLPFADHVHDFDVAENEVLEALYRACDALDRAMVLLDNVVEVFALPNHDFGAVLGIGLTDPGLVRSVLIDVDDLGKTVVLDGMLKNRRAA